MVNKLKLFVILITTLCFTSCVPFNSEICYRVERPDGIIRDTVNFVTFDSECKLEYDTENGYYRLKLEDCINIRNIITTKHPIVIESFHKEKIVE